MNKPTVLVLDDEPGFRAEITEHLLELGYETACAGSPSEALDVLENRHIDIALFDVRLPEMDGLSLLKIIRDKFPALDVVIMTGFGSMDTVVKALRNGAVDFLKKPFKFREMQDVLERALKYRKMGGFSSVATHQDIQDWVGGDINIVGKSNGIHTAIEMIKKVAASDDATVLITGDSGTGKELIAQAIHTSSKRRKQNFVTVNCSNIPDDLFESEFFGHVKGSFTDAKADRIGLFESADKGTLFLDEIGDLKYGLQAKLLRVIEDKKISRLGTVKERKVDVRIIAATNQDLKKMIEQKKFRADLFHRLNLFHIHVPPLNERREDIPLLVDYFFEMFAQKAGKSIKKIDRSVYDQMMQYTFPGNVRELKNMIERAIILCDCEVINCLNFYFETETEPFVTPEDRDMKHPSAIANMRLDEVEEKLILLALEDTGYNKSKAAAILHITRQALDRKIAKYKISLNK